MAKKKFLNLDNMNILWDNIDRNFLRREDIPYTEFEELLTESNTIIGAINELYRLIEGGISPVEPSIDCETSEIESNYEAGTVPVSATYKNYFKINDPQVTIDNGTPGWLTVTQSGSGSTITYSIVLTENNDGFERTGTIVLSCTAKNTNIPPKTWSISVKQSDIGDATIRVADDFPSTLDYEGTSDSPLTGYVYYSNWSSINEPTSDSSWLHIEVVPGNTDRREYRIYADLNDTSSQRNAILIFSCEGKNGNRVLPVEYTITQNAAPPATFEIIPNPINVAWNADNASIQVRYSNYNEVLEYNATLPWPDASVKVVPSGNTYTYYISGITENNSPEEKRGELIFKCKDLLNSEQPSEIIPVIQRAAPAGILVVTPTSTTIVAAGGEIPFAVKFSNTDYYWVEKKDLGDGINWISIDPTSNSTSGGSTSNPYKVTVDANTGNSRSVGLVFKCLGYDNVTTEPGVEVTITQEAYDDTPEVDILPMYYGYIPYDSSVSDSTWASEGFKLITEQMVIDGVSNGNVATLDAGPMGKTSFGNTPVKSFVFIAVPSSSGLVATQDDGNGSKVEFNTNPNTNGDVNLTINNIQYDLYGQIDPIGYTNNKFFYID